MTITNGVQTTMRTKIYACIVCCISERQRVCGVVGLGRWCECKGEKKRNSTSVAQLTVRVHSDTVASDYDLLCVFVCVCVCVREREMSKDLGGRNRGSSGHQP